MGAFWFSLVSQIIQLLNKIINMLIPAFSNKITNVTLNTRLRMPFFANEAKPRAVGTGSSPGSATSSS